MSYWLRLQVARLGGWLLAQSGVVVGDTPEVTYARVDALACRMYREHEAAFEDESWTVSAHVVGEVADALTDVQSALPAVRARKGALHRRTAAERAVTAGSQSV